MLGCPAVASKSQTRLVVKGQDERGGAARHLTREAYELLEGGS
jgi:hypothetical protein